MRKKAYIIKQKFQETRLTATEMKKSPEITAITAPRRLRINLDMRFFDRLA